MSGAHRPVLAVLCGYPLPRTDMLCSAAIYRGWAPLVVEAYGPMSGHSSDLIECYAALIARADAMLFVDGVVAAGWAVDLASAAHDRRLIIWTNLEDLPSGEDFWEIQRTAGVDRYERRRTAPAANLSGG